MRRDAVRRSAAGPAQCRVGDKVHGQQGLEVFEGTGPGEISEDPAQVMIGLEAAGLTGLDEAIQVGGGLGAGHTVMKEPVLSIMQSFA